MVLLAFPAPAAAKGPWKQVAFSEDVSDSSPFVDASALIENSRHFRIRFEGDPGQGLIGTASVRCQRGANSRARDIDLDSLPVPFGFRTQATMKDPDYCIVSAHAFGDFGRLTLGISKKT